MFGEQYRDPGILKGILAAGCVAVGSGLSLVAFKALVQWMTLLQLLVKLYSETPGQEVTVDSCF